MTEEEVSTIQSQLLMISQLLAEMNLPEFLNWIYRAQAAGPLVDPTLFFLGKMPLDQIQEIAEAANGVRRVVLRQKMEQL